MTSGNLSLLLHISEVMAAKTPLKFPSLLMLIFFTIIGPLVSAVGKIEPRTNLLPSHLLSLDIAPRFRFDSDSITRVSTDFGKLVHKNPAAVLYPSSVDDILSLIQASYDSPKPFTIAARGRGHSVRGQAMAFSGVVIDMPSLSKNTKVDHQGAGIRVSWSSSLGHYVDVGGEKLWIDVLNATLEHDLAPVSWTDYLYLTVGGTLSNGGISGQTFLHGPQINNVLEMDVITGKGEFLTCSKQTNSELFYAVLGGLGQFGIITRARIALHPAPKRVKWVRLLYNNFSTFTQDQEHLISMDVLDYVEGSLLLHQSPVNNWRSSFFSQSDHSKIISQVTKHGILYSLEIVKYYDHQTVDTVDKDLESVLEDLSFLPGLIYTRDVLYVDFLNRVRDGEMKLQSKGLWNVLHPWLNLFVPKSRISDFNSGVFRDIILKQQHATRANSGPILVYPMNRPRWDSRMSAVIPEDEEETFYTVGFLHLSGFNDWELLENQNNEILEFCDKADIQAKQYLPHYQTQEDWIKHFGNKWRTFQERKARFDPKSILSPGQNIFNSFSEISVI